MNNVIDAMGKLTIVDDMNRWGRDRLVEEMMDRFGLEQKMILVKSYTRCVYQWVEAM